MPLIILQAGSNLRKLFWHFDKDIFGNSLWELVPAKNAGPCIYIDMRHPSKPPTSTLCFDQLAILAEQQMDERQNRD